jgi:hypothetical protein
VAVGLVRTLETSVCLVAAVILFTVFPRKNNLSVSQISVSPSHTSSGHLGSLSADGRALHSRSADDKMGLWAVVSERVEIVLPYCSCADAPAKRAQARSVCELDM